MAKQESILPIRGSIGDVTYFKRNGKYFCKKKNEFSSQQLRTDEAFAPFRRQSQINVRCITLAAAIYKLTPADKRNGKLYRSIIKWVCNPRHRNKDLDAIINDAFFHFNFMEWQEFMPEKEECIRQIRSALPFTSLIPTEVEQATQAQKPPSRKKSSKDLSPKKDLSLNNDLLTLITAIQQLTAAITGKSIDNRPPVLSNNE